MLRLFLFDLDATNPPLLSSAFCLLLLLALLPPGRKEPVMNNATCRLVRKWTLPSHSMVDANTSNAQKNGAVEVKNALLMCPISASLGQLVMDAMSIPISGISRSMMPLVPSVVIPGLALRMPLFAKKLWWARTSKLCLLLQLHRLLLLLRSRLLFCRRSLLQWHWQWWQCGGIKERQASNVLLYCSGSSLLLLSLCARG